MKIHFFKFLLENKVWKFLTDQSFETISDRKRNNKLHWRNSNFFKEIFDVNKIVPNEKSLFSQLKAHGIHA